MDELKRVVFSKYNRERLPEFQTETVIYKKGTTLFVKKRPLSREADNHIRQIFENFVLLQKHYRNVRIAKARLETDGIVFEHIGGTRLDQLMVRAILQNDKSRLFGLVSDHAKFVRGLGTVKSKEIGRDEARVKIFGRDVEPHDMLCNRIANIDLNFDNILVDEGGEKAIIDYEWVYDFPIPICYVLFRGIHYFNMKCWKYLRKVSGPEELFDVIGLDSKEIEISQRMERSFLRHVHGPTYHYWIPDAYLKNRKQIFDLERMDHQVEEKDARISRLEERIREQEDRLNAILASKTWRIGQCYGKIRNALIRLKARIT